MIRSRRRTFSSILGVLLAITFIAGTLIAIDSSTRSTLYGLIENLPSDFSYYASVRDLTDVSTVRDAVAAVRGVADASVYLSLFGYELRDLGGGYWTWINVEGIDPAHLPADLRDVQISGDLALPQGSVGITADVASTLQLGLGDILRLENPEYAYDGTILRTWTLNLTVAAIAQTPTVSSPYFYRPPNSLAFVHIRDGGWVLQQLNYTTYGSYGVAGDVWVQRDRLLDPYNLEATRHGLIRLERDLAFALSPYGGYVNNYLRSAVDTFESTVSWQRVQFLLLSTPVMLLGLYLGAVGVDLGHAERRRELAVLKTRGARRRQVIGMLLLESVVGGLIAALVGLAAGVAVSRFLLGVVTPSGAVQTPAYGDVLLSVETIVTVAVLGIFFMAVASFRSARRTADLPIVESLHYYAPGETKIQYKPTLDIVFVAYGIVAYAVVWFSRGAQYNVILFLVGAIFIASLPAIPILLIIGVTRLVTRSTGRIYEATARIFRPLARNLEYVISRNLGRNPRRSANIAIIIALGVAFGVFAVSLLGSQEAYQENVLRASVGADLSVSPFPGAGRSFGSNLSEIPGVAGVTEVVTLGASTAYCCAGVVALDPGTYFSVAYLDSYYFGDAGPDGAAQTLARQGYVLITDAYRRQAALEVGDTLPLSATIYPNGTPLTVSTNVIVGGVVRFLPGAGGGYIGFGSTTAVYGSFQTLAPLGALNETGLESGSYRVYLVSLEPVADWQAVKEGVVALGASSVIVFAEQLAIQQGNVPGNALLGFIQMEIAFIVVILTAGLGLIIYAASLERDVEFAAIAARGSSGWQTAGLLVGEALSIMVIGVLIGTAVGLGSGFFYALFFFASSIGGPEPVVPFLFVFPVEGLLLLALAPLAMIGTTLLVSWRVAHMNVAKVLKMRGG